MPNIAYAIVLLSIMTLVVSLSPEVHALSPHAQFQSGVPLEEILCVDEKVLLESPRGTPACVKESSVERMIQRGFVLVQLSQTADEPRSTDKKSTSIDNTGSDTGKVPPESAIIPQESQDDTRSDIQTVDKEPKLTTLKVASPTEFVDDGREYPRAMQRRPSPEPIYDKIMIDMTTDGGGMVVGQSGDATFYSSEHEKYSVNSKVGFHLKDWLPTHIPDGYKLLFGGTLYETYAITITEYEEYKAYFKFVPTTFVMYQNLTDYELDTSKGFLIQVIKTTAPIDETEDLIEGNKKLFSKPPVWYGDFRDIERDGKPVYAFEGGNSVNPYRSVLYWKFADDAYLSIISDYMTLDEIIPIFESMKN
ncbi:MAG: hypothetical protein EB828_00430 [Nitrosopumilus sp. D6]|nr:MAG: hypothetical protein EB828_00430 [Nitrosopumilus sp. D6]